MECLASDDDRGFIEACLDIAFGGNNVACFEIYHSIWVRHTKGTRGMGLWVETICFMVLGCVDSPFWGVMV